MTPNEKRRFQRRDSLQLLDYQIIDKSGNEGEYSMGRTLDISVNGIKLETSRKVPMDKSLVITLAIEDNLVDLLGKPVHSHQADNWYISGIEFNKISSEGCSILRQYIDELQIRRAEPAEYDYPPLPADTL